MLMLNQIHKGDCMDFFKQIPDKSVDLGVTDCPYLIKTGGARIADDSTGGVLSRYDKTDPKGCLSRPLKIISPKDLKSRWLKQNNEENRNFVKTGKLFEHCDIKFEVWLPELYRVLKDKTHCYIFVNSRNLKELQFKAEKAGFIFQNLLVWKKNNQTPNKYYMQQCEFILMLRKGNAKNVNNMGLSNVLEIPNIVGHKLHPTEKPVNLNKIIIKQSSNEYDLVIDQFMGSGSTAIACLETNRTFIGAEINEVYYKRAIERIKDYEPQLKLL